MYKNLNLLLYYTSVCLKNNYKFSFLIKKMKALKRYLNIFLMKRGQRSNRPLEVYSVIKVPQLPEPYYFTVR